MRTIIQKQPSLPAVAVVTTCFSVITAMSASAALDLTFDNSDLILGVQSSSATSTVLEFNVGAPLLYKDKGGESFLVGNISLQLSNIFGGSWWDNPNLFLGVSAANNNTSISAGSANANGDFNSTVYASRARTGDLSAGLSGSTAYSISAPLVTNAASALVQQGIRFDENDANGFAALASSLSNEWSDFNPVSGTTQNPAYNTVFTTGIQYRFDVGTFDTGSFAGLANVEGVVDLYRLTRFSNGGATPGQGEYLGSFAIERDGDVHFVEAVPEPGTAAALALGVSALAARRRRRKA